MAITRLLLPGALLVTLTAGLGGCGGTDHSGHLAGGGSAASSAPAASAAAGQVGHNDQDVAFANNMISHHRQAIEMAALAGTRSSNPEVVALGERILAAQAPELDLMSGWLKGWGMAPPEDMSAMDMGGSMPGMMSLADLKALTASKGAAFDQQFLTMMIAHHEGALVMAKDQLSRGQLPESKQLCQRIVAGQSAEIAEMKALLG